MRADQWEATVVVEGQNIGVWDKLTGGEVDSDDSRYRPGGMAPPVSLGGAVTVGNVTLQRLYRLDRDHGQIKWLIGLAGRGNVVINRKALDVDGNAFGKPLTYTGTLKSVTPPEIDSESSDAALISIEVTPVGTVV